jgi:competence ComEA-like helix-hairpin-helix protein
VLVAAAVAGLSAANLALVSSAAPPQEAREKTRTTFLAACGKCHPPEKVTATRRTRVHWEEVITTMITTRGAQISDEDFDVVLEYLVKEHGTVNVNRAPAEDLIDVLEVSESAASAIVKHRTEHGPFKDFEALLKVPGIDRKALETKRDAVTF